MKKFPILTFLHTTIVLLSLLLSGYCYAAEHLRQPQIEQQPFLCKTIEAGLGSPIIDNDFSIGTPVYNINNVNNVNITNNSNAKVLGYSQHCAVKPQTEYFYKSKLDGKFYKLEKTDKYPDNLATTKRGNPYIVKVDKGTLNRFLYLMLILQDPIKLSQLNTNNTNNTNNKTVATYWNHKLVYYFGGGVGTGFVQASDHSLAYIKDFSKLLSEIDFLNEGYAVVFSTGTTSSTHYNLQLGLQTANELKKLFSKTYHKPQLTIGFGSSGGAIQGYVYAEKDKNLLDGIIATHSYPDMISQIIHVGDCELLEHYFDTKAQTEWDWDRRQLIEGMHSSSNMFPIRNFGNPHTQKFADKNNGLGCSSCVNGWRGTIPIALNPHFNTIPGIDKIRQKGRGFSHFEDVSLDWQHGVYPRDGFNYTQHIYDNEGVQYGLKALINAKLSKEEFFDLNLNVGGWKPTELLRPEEGIPFATTDIDDAEFNPWSAHNAFQVNSTSKVAARSTIPKDLATMVQKSGLYFSGNINIPVIDWRPYLDHTGDMHFAYGSFMARSRILRFNNDFDNQIIWMSALPEEHSIQKPNYTKQLTLALNTLDLWLTNYKHKAHGETLAANKPENAIDACFDADGTTIYQGENAWDGVIDKKSLGKCSIDPKFTIYSTSRIEALQAATQDTFKCKLIPIKEFINNGGYGAIEMEAQDVLMLEHIFPTGVCEIES